MSTYFGYSSGYFWLQCQVCTTPRQPLSYLALSVAIFGEHRCGNKVWEHSVGTGTLARSSSAARPSLHAAPVSIRVIVGGLLVSSEKLDFAGPHRPVARILNPRLFNPRIFNQRHSAIPRLRRC